MIDQPVIAPATPVYTRVFRGFRTVRRLPVLPVFVLGVVVVAGIFAPWIAPHDPTKGDLRDRNLPGFWSGDQTTMKIVVEEVEYGEVIQAGLAGRGAGDPVPAPRWGTRWRWSRGGPAVRNSCWARITWDATC